MTSTGALRILLYQLAGSQSTSWDDVTVIPVPPRNAGFETGALGGWTQGYVGTGSAAVGNTAHWGSDGLVFGPNSGDELVYQDITGLAPGQTYLLSAWVKGSANSGNSVTVAATTQEPGNAWAVAPHVTPTTSWQPITEPYTVTSTGGMRFLLYQLGGSQNTYWDDVLIMPLPPVNAGFENGALWPWNASFVTTGSAALSGWRTGAATAWRLGRIRPGMRFCFRTSPGWPRGRRTRSRHG